MIIAVVLLMVTVMVSLSIGRYWVDPLTIVKVLLSKVYDISVTWEREVETVLFQIRLPRILLGLFVGAILSLVGTTYQGIFRNPLVSADVLGTSWGAGFGAALGLLLSFGYVNVTIMAFGFGILAVLLVVIMGKTISNNKILGIVLSGIMIGSLFSSGISYIKLIADPLNELPAITYWLMGSLASAKWTDVRFIMPVFFVGVIPIYILRWRMNLLTLGEEEAKTLGISVEQTRMVLILCATLLTAAAVSVSGMIGWVGLVIPHVARKLVGNDYRKLVPMSMLAGASFLLIVDDVARTIVSVEIPLGILTSVVGAPSFLYLIYKEGGRI